jgi:hypothetical protein
MEVIKMKKFELVNVAQGIISEIGLLNSVKEESRNSILNFIGQFGSEVDKLINKFYDINSNIADNGGAPVLKQLINKLYEDETLTIEIAKETTCLMLVDNEKNLIGHQFINKYEFYDIVQENKLTQLVKNFARKYNLEKFYWGGLV